METTEKRETLVNNEPTGDYTESGNNKHGPDGKFVGQTKCIGLKDTKNKRDEPNELCYQALVNGKMNKIPNNLKEALEIFEMSCLVEHEEQKGNQYDFDEKMVQPYSQKYIMKKWMEDMWNNGRPCQIIYNPYNKYDKNGCDYVMFFGKKGTKFTDENVEIKKKFIDQKSNLSSLDITGKGTARGHKLYVKHKSPNKNYERKGFFNSDGKITDEYLFSIMYSKRVKDGKLKSPDEIDNSNNFIITKDRLEQSVKAICGYKGTVEEFFDDIYNNKCNVLENYFNEVMQTNIVTKEMRENNFRIIRNTKGEAIIGALKIGNYDLKIQSDENNNLSMYLDVNVEDLHKFSPKGSMLKFSEEGGLDDFIKKSQKQVEN